MARVRSSAPAISARLCLTACGGVRTGGAAATTGGSPFRPAFRSPPSPPLEPLAPAEASPLALPFSGSAPNSAPARGRPRAPTGTAPHTPMVSSAIPTVASATVAATAGVASTVTWGSPSMRASGTHTPSSSRLPRDRAVDAVDPGEGHVRRRHHEQAEHPERGARRRRSRRPRRSTAPAACGRSAPSRRRRGWRWRRC